MKQRFYLCEGKGAHFHKYSQAHKQNYRLNFRRPEPTCPAGELRFQTTFFLHGIYLFISVIYHAVIRLGCLSRLKSRIEIKIINISGASAKRSDSQKRDVCYSAIMRIHGRHIKWTSIHFISPTDFQ